MKQFKPYKYFVDYHDTIPRNIQNSSFWQSNQLFQIDIVLVGEL